MPDAAQVKPEPEDATMATEAAPTAGQAIKAEPPTQASADPNTDASGLSVQQGDAADGGSADALPSKVSAVIHAGSLTPESSAEVVYAKCWGCTEPYFYLCGFPVSHWIHIREWRMPC